MNIIRKSPDKYGLQKVGKKCHRIVKILKEYEDEQQAVNDLSRLMVGEMSEQELVGKPEYDNSKVELLNILEVALKALDDEANYISAMPNEAVYEIERVLKKYGRRENNLVEGGKEE